MSAQAAYRAEQLKQTMAAAAARVKNAVRGPTRVCTMQCPNVLYTRSDHARAVAAETQGDRVFIVRLRKRRQRETMVHLGRPGRPIYTYTAVHRTDVQVRYRVVLTVSAR